MIFLLRLTRSTLTWVHTEHGEDWDHRLAGTVTTIVSFPVVLAVCALLLLLSAAFQEFNPEVYGVKRLFVALWLLIWVILFFPVDRITRRHVAGAEPVESRWFVVQFTAVALAAFVLAALWVAGAP